MSSFCYVDSLKLQMYLVVLFNSFILRYMCVCDCNILFLAAYKHADGRKIDGRRVLVDVERARTVKGWRPRRLGGGLGGTRKGRSRCEHQILRQR